MLKFNALLVRQHRSHNVNLSNQFIYIFGFHKQNRSCNSFLYFLETSSSVTLSKGG